MVRLCTAETWSMKPEIEMEPDAMERMNRALREAMKTPPKPRKAEAKRGVGKRNKNQGKAK